MKLIVVTPAGREKYLRLLSHYVLRSPEVAEWHLWDNCRNAVDRVYLHSLAASDARCKLKQLPGADGNFGIIGSFFQFCDDADALYLRLDDDIVFIEEGFFPRFVARAMACQGITRRGPFFPDAATVPASFLLEGLIGGGQM